MELGLNEILLTNNSLIVKELKVIKYMELVKLDINKFDVDIIAGLIYETDVKTFDSILKIGIML